MWVPPETKDPVLFHQPTRKSVGDYGAVRLRDGQFFFQQETGKFNALTCWEFLKELCGARPDTTTPGCTATGGSKTGSISA